MTPVAAPVEELVHRVFPVTVKVRPIDWQEPRCGHCDGRAVAWISGENLCADQGAVELRYLMRAAVANYISVAEIPETEREALHLEWLTGEH